MRKTLSSTPTSTPASEQIKSDENPSQHNDSFVWIRPETSAIPASRKKSAYRPSVKQRLAR